MDAVDATAGATAEDLVRRVLDIAARTRARRVERDFAEPGHDPVLFDPAPPGAQEDRRSPSRVA